MRYLSRNDLQVRVAELEVLIKQKAAEAQALEKKNESIELVKANTASALAKANASLAERATELRKAQVSSGRERWRGERERYGEGGREGGRD